MAVRDVVQAAAGALGGGNPNAWDISKAYHDPGTSAGDLSTVYYTTRTLDVYFQDTNPQGAFFKPDGTALFMVGRNTQKIYEYSCLYPWTLFGASYSSNSFSVSTQTTGPIDVSFKSDGTKMYVLSDSNSRVYEYDLSTAWDITSATYSQYFSIATQEQDGRGLFFKPDGTKMYISGSQTYNRGTIWEYNLSTAWDVSTTSYSQYKSVNAQDLGAWGVSFNSDGTKMFMFGGVGLDANEYTLSTAWDVTTATYEQNFVLSNENSAPSKIFMRPNFSCMYMVGNTNPERMYQYSIGGFATTAEETAPRGLFFKDDGTKMYVTGQTGDDVNEYNLSTAWDVNTASYSQLFSVASQDTSPQALFFKGDGTIMYMLGGTNSTVYQYTLSTAWDVSTASYASKSFSVASQATQQAGLYFKDDGTKMYAQSYGTRNVYEYNLSTAWDVSTASYSGNSFYMGTQDSTMLAMVLKPDGTKMYTVGNGNDKMYEYDLSTAWDISTASFSQDLYIGAENVTPTGLFFNPDGTQFFTIDYQGDSIKSYLISEE